jgi:putative endonuclease
VAGTLKFDLYLYKSNNVIMYYTYILQNEDKSLYIGYSSDLKQRIQDHSNGKGCKTTKNKTGWKLIYYEAYLDKEDAIGREKFLKGGSGRKYINKQLKHYFAS